MLRQPTTTTLFPYTTLFRSFVWAHSGPGARMTREGVSATTADSLLWDGWTLTEIVDDVVEVDGVRIHRSEEHTSELQSQSNLVCRLLLEKKKIKLKSKQ